ncbi:MAG TPA: amidohydrolase family protein [Vicinamibacterales bacterium]|jgi:imidazolonepropionase-like amidohydrolase|nr:amidohydrolase family protein [Vicinamibacterales bacterium]
MLFRRFARTAAGALAFAFFAGAPQAQTPSPANAAVHAKQVKRLLITNAMVIPGPAVPASGPIDILLEEGLINRMGASAGARWPAADMVIDAAGKYVMPGIVNTHMHWHEERVGPLPIQYERNLYLAAGVTTAREVGGDFEKTKQWRADSAAHRIIAPRIVHYPMLRDLLKPGETFNGTPAEFRALVRQAKDRGADGIKLIGPMDRDQVAATLDEAKKAGLRTTVHVAVGEATARDFVDLGVNCIEHFYGVADAALEGIQDFPPEMNYANEIHRFGRAGELYTQHNLDPAKLSKLLDDMIAKGVAWSPTMSTYEATRDLIRAQNLPWYRELLHPSLEEYYKPSMARHGTFWTGWTATQEVRWRKNYQVWMATLRDFGLKGGVITTGDDAGYLYGSLYGFGISRELELHEEAGFHPLEVLKHATSNGAKVLGMEDRLGRVRVGFMADLLVVNGNPLENLRVMNPYGVDLMAYNGQIINNYSGIVKPADPNVKSVHGGGIEWTIKDGIPYHVPTLIKEVKDLVAKGRAERTRTTSPQQ